MSSISFWNNSQISPEQQRQFLDAAGLDAMPEASAMSEAQWKILAGVVGENTVKTIRESAGVPPLSNPSLPPSVGGDWTKIMMLVQEVRAKFGNAVSRAALEVAGGTKDKIDGILTDGLAKLSDGLVQTATAYAATEAELYGKAAGNALALAEKRIETAEAKLEDLKKSLADAEGDDADAIARKIGEAEASLKGMKSDLARIKLEVADAVKYAGLAAKADTIEEARNYAELAKKAAENAYGLAGMNASGLQIDPDAAYNSPRYLEGLRTVVDAVNLLSSSEIGDDQENLKLYLARIQQKIDQENARLSEAIENVNKLLLEADDMLQGMESAKHRIFRRTTM